MACSHYVKDQRHIDSISQFFLDTYNFIPTDSMILRCAIYAVPMTDFGKASKIPTIGKTLIKKIDEETQKKLNQFCKNGMSQPEIMARVLPLADKIITGHLPVR